MPQANGNWRSAATAVVFLGVMVLAAALRFPLLGERPMHGDEAVNADRLGVLLDTGRFEYSWNDFHGPTLYYLSLLAARTEGAKHYTELSEAMLRSVPAILGVLLAGAHIFLIRYLGFWCAAAAGLLTAVSPAMVYYSRDYIHEILLVFLTFCALLSAFRYWEERRRLWALVTGVFVGLMYATKETVIIPVACMILAGMGVIVIERRQSRATRAIGDSIPPMDVLTALAGATLVSVILMSSFLSTPRGVIDSVLAYRTYFARGLGISTLHVHPWSYYFNLLFFYHRDGGPLWSEGLILALALIGPGAAFAMPPKGVNKSLLRFLCLYTGLMAGIYSFLPYKVPWNALGVLHGMILMAGAGTAAVFQILQSTRTKALVIAVVGAGVAHLGWQAQAASIRFAADPRSPWVYAQTGKDVYGIAAQLELLAAASPSAHALPVQIISPENLWPLPWYLRRFTGVRWSNAVLDATANAPVILATPEMEMALIRKLYEIPPPGQRELYVPMFDRYVELRPQVEIRGYVAKSLWDSLQAKQTENEAAPVSP